MSCLLAPFAHIYRPGLIDVQSTDWYVTGFAIKVTFLWLIQTLGGMHFMFREKRKQLKKWQLNRQQFVGAARPMPGRIHKHWDCNIRDPVSDQPTKTIYRSLPYCGNISCREKAFSASPIVDQRYWSIEGARRPWRLNLWVYVRVYKSCYWTDYYWLSVQVFHLSDCKTVKFSIEQCWHWPSFQPPVACGP